MINILLPLDPKKSFGASKKTRLTQTRAGGGAKTNTHHSPCCSPTPCLSQSPSLLCPLSIGGYKTQTKRSRRPHNPSCTENSNPSTKPSPGVNTRAGQLECGAQEGSVRYALWERLSYRQGNDSHIGGDKKTRSHHAGFTPLRR